MAKIEAKQVVIDEIKSKLEKAQGVVLVNARGLSVAQDTEMRRSLREAGVDYKVYKNTMVNFAVKDTPFEALAPHLEGPTAIAVSYEDSTSGARALDKFIGQFAPLTYKGGVIEGTYYNEAEIEKIGKIPSKNELLSKLLGSLKSPMSSFARVVKEIAAKGGAGEASAAPKEEKAEEAAPAEEAKEAVAEKVEEVKEAVVEKVEEAKEAVAEKAEEVKEAVAEKVEEAKEAVSEKAEEVKEAVAEKVEEAKEKAAEVVEEIKEAIEDAKNE